MSRRATPVREDPRRPGIFFFRPYVNGKREYVPLGTDRAQAQCRADKVQAEIDAHTWRNPREVEAQEAWLRSDARMLEDIQRAAERTLVEVQGVRSALARDGLRRWEASGIRLRAVRGKANVNLATRSAPLGALFRSLRRPHPPSIASERVADAYLQSVGFHTIWKGAPDAFAISPNGAIVGVEVKTEGGKLSPVQQDAIALLREGGIDTIVLYVGGGGVVVPINDARALDPQSDEGLAEAGTLLDAFLSRELEDGA